MLMDYGRSFADDDWLTSLTSLATTAANIYTTVKPPRTTAAAPPVIQPPVSQQPPQNQSRFGPGLLGGNTMLVVGGVALLGVLILAARR